jgi:GH25 family lysozyme M1 (1,4-beta-N-acetylmuramidase)/fibronectin type 3 domain-containing protein
MRKTTTLLALAVAAAALFSDVPATLYADTLSNTSEVEGEVLLTTDSPFTDLTYTHENKFEDYELFNGIDISKWNNLACADGVIDWAACKEAGVDFAIIRVGYRQLNTGELIEDPYYKQNIEGALANDISVGVYFFSEALTAKEARAEAKFILKRIKKYDVTLPVVIDYEGGYYTDNGNKYPGRVEAAYQDGSLTKASATKVVRAFCNYVDEAGYTPMVYANSNYLLSNINGASLGKKYQVWQARYAESTDPNNGYLYYDGSYDYWQYSENGYIGEMKVDCNFLYKNFNVRTSQPQVTEQTADTITLEWEPTSDALGYRVYRLNPDTGKYVKIATTSECVYTDEELSTASEYTYRILAYWKIGGSTYTAKNSKTLTWSTSVKKVKNLTEESRTDTSVTLSWDAVSKANGYVIYQYDADEEEYLEVVTVSGKSNTTYEVTGLSASKEYRFAVCAYRKYNGEKLTGEISDELKTRTNPAKVESLTATGRTSKSITLSFTKQKRVTGYIVYRYNAKTGKWKQIGISTNGTFTDDTVAANTSYKYRVRAYKESGGATYYGKYSKALTVKSAKKS